MSDQDEKDPPPGWGRLAFALALIIFAPLAVVAMGHWYQCMRLAPIERLFIPGC
ncbi:MAG: hypothetical protein KGK34_07205 [Chloroflexota bacterium]|nr:hypothetical protein [Chloroflexota bacterium]